MKVSHRKVPEVTRRANQRMSVLLCRAWQDFAQRLGPQQEVMQLFLCKRNSVFSFRSFKRTTRVNVFVTGMAGWEQHTKGIGAKLLLQMGYQPGKGLGKDLQGIAQPVQAHMRSGRGAIGAYGPEKVITDCSFKKSKRKTEICNTFSM